MIEFHIPRLILVVAGVGGTEEEIEFEETDENLIYEISSSHLDRGTDMFIDCPPKFIEEFPGYYGEYYCRYSNDTRYGNKKWFDSFEVSFNLNWIYEAKDRKLVHLGVY
jgi:hypothetical protein